MSGRVIGFFGQEDSSGSPEESYWVFGWPIEGFQPRRIFWGGQKNLTDGHGGEWGYGGLGQEDSPGSPEESYWGFVGPSGFSSQGDSSDGPEESYGVNGVYRGGFRSRRFSWNSRRLLRG